MTTATIEAAKGHAYLADFAPADGEPAWLKGTRQAAFDAFATLGFPTRKHEDWRFTSVAPIAKRDFAILAPGTATAEEIAGLAIPFLDAHRLVFVDGHFAPELSDVGELPEGVHVGNLAGTLARDGAALEANLTQHVSYAEDAFVALNTAFFADGVHVVIPKDVELERPVYALFVDSGQVGAAMFPRNLIEVGSCGKVAVILDSVTLKDAASFTDAVTEVVLGDGAHATTYNLEREDLSASNIATLRIEQGRDSHFTNHSVSIGSGLSRNLVHPVLNGAGAYSVLNGLYFPAGSQHIDNFMRVEHAQPHGASRQYYKGILRDEARGVFSGRIVVHEGAQKTDAVQANENMLLSDSAQVDTKPQLEIYADDVKCTHGAVIGKVDAGMMFYLMARGLPREQARGILIHAFFGEYLERMELGAVARFLERAILTKLEQFALLETLPELGSETE